MQFPATTALGQAFASVVNGICAVLSKHAPAAAARAVTFAQVYWRIARRIGRLDRLVQRWHAGTLPQPRAPRPRAPLSRPTLSRPILSRPTQLPAEPPAPRIRTPDSHAMLLRLAQPTAQFRGHLEMFLQRPDTRALVSVAPQAARILRPLCRILAIDLPEYLRPPPRPAPMAKPAPRRVPAARPVHPPATNDRPLPGYVRAAARAWKKYDR